MNAADVVAEFRAALRAHGIVPPEHIQADGQLHRCDVDARNGSGDGAYVLHLDGVPAGGFQNWQSGDGWQDWCAKDARSLTPQERVQWRARAEQSRREREAASAARYVEAQERARQIWDAATAAPADHPYLMRKGVQPHHVRLHAGHLTISGTDCTGALVVPLRDATGQLHSVEFITADGSKRYLPGGRVSGCYFPIGKPDDVLVIAEGFATAASIHEATGHATACAFNAGNLKPVATALRAKMPRARIVIAADNDAASSENVGVVKAREAAQAVNAFVAIPELDGGKADFNDLMLARGGNAVRAAIEGAEMVPADTSTDDVAATTLTLRRASEIPIEPVSWLWPEWLAAGKLHILAGVPGTGKTTIALSLAATITRGGYWPDGERFLGAGNVVMWSGEDDPSDTLVPRLAAMGADLSRIHFVGDCTGPDGRRAFDPARDMPALMAKAREIGDVRLLIVDPVVTAVAGDSHRNAEVRRGLAPLVEFGQRLRAAVLGISHYSKNTSGRDPLDRLTGSLAFGALARLVFGAARKLDDDGKEECRVLVRVKSNIGRDGGAITYTLDMTALAEGVTASCVQWGHTIEGSAREILDDAERADDAGGERSAQREAEEFLRATLADGPVSVTTVHEQAGAAGITPATLRRAKATLEIQARKTGMAGGWTWQLPPKVLKSAEGAQQNSVSTFGDIEHLRDAEAF